MSESPFSIQVFRFSSVTLFPLTLKVPRLFSPFNPGPIFLASLVSKWQMLHFSWNTSCPRLTAAGSFAAPAADFFVEPDFDGLDCAKSAPAQASDAIPKRARERFTFFPRRIRWLTRLFWLDIREIASFWPDKKYRFR